MTTIRAIAHIPSATHTLATVLAHQGGWDEGLIVAGPLLVIVGLLWLARSRAAKLEHPQPPADTATPSSATPSSDS